MTDLYQEELLEHYKHPQNKGSFSSEKKDLKTVKNNNVGCGDEVTVELLTNDQNVVNDIRWQGNGCVISMAGMSVISEFVKGKPTSEILQYNQDTLLELLHLHEIVPARVKCLTLGLRTIQRAIDSSI